jgi:hypothetical protein
MSVETGIKFYVTFQRLLSVVLQLINIVATSRLLLT